MPKLREPYTFFADRSLGRRKVVDALRAAGELVEVHDEHFGAAVEDEVWLAHAGAQGWVVLTKDKHVSHRLIEIEALHDAGVAAFILSSSDVSGEAMGRAFVTALPAMKALLASTDTPFIARISTSGSITQTLDREGIATRVHRKRPKPSGEV